MSRNKNKVKRGLTRKNEDEECVYRRGRWKIKRTIRKKEREGCGQL
jgi:hypothetical protein